MLITRRSGHAMIGSLITGDIKSSSVAYLSCICYHLHENVNFILTFAMQQVWVSCQPLMPLHRVVGWASASSLCSQLSVATQQFFSDIA